MGDSFVDRCAPSLLSGGDHSGEGRYSDGRNNTLPRAKKLSPAGAPHSKRDLTKRIALYDDFNNSTNPPAKVAPLFKKTAESIVRGGKKKLPSSSSSSTSGESRLCSAVTDVVAKRGTTLKVRSCFLFSYKFISFSLLAFIFIFV